MAFDVAGAKAAGYSDTDIADEIAKANKFDADGARKAGYSDSEIIAHLNNPHPATPGYAKGVAESFGHGATLGMSDNIAGFVDALLARTSHPLMQDVRDNIAIRKAERQQFESEHPVIGNVSELAGGVTGGLLLAPLAPEVLAMREAAPVMNAVRGTVGGGLMGAAQGAADADPGHTLSGAESGGMVGAVSSLGFSALAPLVAKSATGASNGLMSLFNRYINGVRAEVVPNARAAAPLANALIDSGTTPQSLRDTLQAADAMGVQHSIASASRLGGNVQMLGKDAILKPGPGKDIGRDALDASVADMLPQARNKLSEMSGLPVTDAEELAAKEAASQQAKAPGAYAAIPDISLQGSPMQVSQPGKILTLDGQPSAGVRNTDSFSQMLEDNPAYARAHNDAVASNNSTSFSDQRITPLFDSEGKITRAPTWKDVDAMKKALDARIRTAKGIPIADDAKAAAQLPLKNLTNANALLMEATDKLSPEYAAVRKQWGDSAELQDALQSGRDTSMKGVAASPFETGQELGGYSDPAQKAFKLGTLSGIDNRLRSVVDSSKFPNLPAELIGAGEEAGKKQQMLETVFGDTAGGSTEAVGKFIDQMRVLAKRYDTRNFMGRDGSAENLQNAVGQDIGSGLSSLVHSPQGFLARMAGHGIDALAGRGGEAKRAAIASELFTPRAGDQADSFMNMLDSVYKARKASAGRSLAIQKAAPVVGAMAVRRMDN